MTDPVGFDEVRSNPPFLVRWRPFTTSLAVLFFAIHSKRIARYPLVSVDQVRFCGELLFFSSSFFFFFPLFIFFPLPIFKSWDRFSPYFLPITLFFFFPSFPPLLHFFFPLLFCPTLISSFHFPPAFHFILFPFLFSSVNLFSSPVHQSTFITIPRSQINVINIYLQSMFIN